MVNLLAEEFKILTKVSSFHVKTIAFVTSAISTQNSNFPMQYLWPIFSKNGPLERQLTTFSERLKHIYPENVYELTKILFDKLEI